jgi:acyl-CoA oxidase
MTLHQLVGIGQSLRRETPEAFGQILSVLKDGGQPTAVASSPAVAAYKKLQTLLHLNVGSGNTLLNRPEDLLALHEMAAIHDGTLVSLLTIHYNLCLGTISALGNDSEYVGRLHQSLQNGDAVGVYLATEIAYGNNVAAMETQAEYLPDREEFLLHSPHPGAYKFMPNTQLTVLPKVAVVMARLKVAGKDYGVVPFLLPLHENNAPCKGVRISALGEKPGFALDNAITSFHEVLLPFDALLSGDILSLSRDGSVTLHDDSPRNRFLMAMSRVQTGKLCMAKMSLSMAKATLHITARYGQKRMTFSDHGPVPIISYNSFADRLAFDTAAVIMLSLWTESLAKRLFSEALRFTNKIPEALKDELAIAKAQVSWRMREVLVTCREMCGAQGLFSHNKIADYYTVNNGVITAEGDNLVIMLKAGRDYLMRTPLAPAQPDDPNILRLLQPLQCHLEKSAKQLRDALQNGTPETRFSRWNDRSEDVLNMIHLHGVLCTVADISSLSLTSSEWSSVKFCAELYLLEWLEKLNSQLISEGSLDSSTARQFQLRKRSLVQQHRQDLLSLIDLFDLEACELETPISGDNYIQWYAKRHRANAN